MGLNSRAGLRRSGSGKPLAQRGDVDDLGGFRWGGSGEGRAFDSLQQGGGTPAGAVSPPGDFGKVVGRNIEGSVHQRQKDPASHVGVFPGAVGTGMGDVEFLGEAGKRIFG